VELDNVALDLYVRVNGKYKKLSALAVGPTLKPIQKVKISEAFQKYIDTCTIHKCTKNQKVETMYFEILGDFLKDEKAFHIDEVTRFHMEKFEALLLKKQKASSVNRRFNTFKHFFNQMVEWEHIRENPCKTLKKRREEKNPHLVWDEKDFHKFLKSTSGIYNKIFQFLWLTGCRPMEVKNLKWTDVNHDEGLLTLKCGKNAGVSRTFPITDDLSKLLHNIKLDSLFVFSDNKTQVSNDLLYHYCKTRLHDLGLKKYTVYGLRHTFGTKLADSGVNVFLIAHLMGHSKIETTRRYVKIEHEKLAEALSVMKLK